MWGLKGYVFQKQIQVLGFCHNLKNIKDFDYISNVNRVSIMGECCEDLLCFSLQKMWDENIVLFKKTLVLPRFLRKHNTIRVSESPFSFWSEFLLRVFSENNLENCFRFLLQILGGFLMSCGWCFLSSFLALFNHFIHKNKSFDRLFSHFYFEKWW